MPDLSYPGVYIEERAGAPATIQGTASSVLALVGWTEKGPVNDPVLVSGFKEFERKFGGFTQDGLVPTMLHAFFKNGGQYARIVRIAGAGAEEGVAYFREPVADEDTGVDGDNSDTTISFTLDDAPVEPGSLAHSYWHRIAAVVAQAGVAAGANPRAGTVTGLSDGIEAGTFTATDGVEAFTDDHR
jgi:hypothetical protein